MVGTRVLVQSLFDYLEGGETLDEFLRQLPSVRREQAVTDSIRKNGDLLQRIRGEYDALTTGDRGIEF